MLYSNYLKDKSQNAIKIKEAEGNPCVIENSKGRNLKDYKIYGNSYQATRGKNLWDEKQDFSFTGNGTQVGTSLNLSTSFKSNTQYTISLYFTASDITFSEEGNLVFLNISYTDGSSQYAGITSYNYTQGVALVTTLSGKSVYKIANITPHARFSSGTINIQKIQLEEGTEATSYEQYKNMPSVEFPSEVQSVGDLTTKNLLPNDWENGFISTTSGNNQSSSIYVRTKGYFTLDISKNYYISSDSIDTRTTISWYFYDENKNFISRFVSYKDRTIGTSDCNVTVPTNAVFFRLAVLTTDTTIKVQIEEDSIATEYEPYHKYKIPIKINGKNLFDINKSIAGYITGNGIVIMNDKIDTSDFIFVQEGEKYTFSYKYDTLGGTTGKAIGFYNNKDESSWIKSVAYIPNSKEVKITSPITGWMRISYYNNIYDIQLEKGTTATEYEHYIEPITTNIYLDEPLRKVGDYVDYIDFKNQKVVRKVKELELNENINFITYEITATGHKGFRFYRSDMLSGIRDYGYCTHIENIPFYELSNIWFGVNNPIIYMSFPDIYNQGETDDERKAAFYTFLSAQAKSGTPVKVIYILATPTEEPISLPALKTFKGTTIMSVDTLVRPSNIKAKYIRL